MSKRRTAKDWSTVMKRWQQSGLSAKDFAAAEGLVASTLSWWKWQLDTKERLSKSEPVPKKAAPKKAAPRDRSSMRAEPKKPARKKPTKRKAVKRRARRARGREQAPVRLVELVAQDAASPKETPLELVVGDDVIVRVRRGFDTETLRRLLSVFGGEGTAQC